MELKSVNTWGNNGANDQTPLEDIDSLVRNECSEMCVDVIFLIGYIII